MCNPALALMAVATAVTAYGQYETGQAQKAQGKYNAKVAEHQALDAQRRGAIAEEEHRARVRQILGSQRAAFGANNVVSSTGSPLGLLADTAGFGELDALTIRNNAARESLGYKVEAKHERMRGRAAAREGALKAGGTLLTGGAQAYGTWKQGKK